MRTMVCLSILIVGLLSVSNSEAYELFATQRTTTLSLSHIDQATGASTHIGTVADTRPLDLASLPESEPYVWAVTTQFTDNSFELIGFDPLSATLASRVSIQSDDPILTLAIDPADGTFFGTTETSLVELDPLTGAVSVVGETSLPIDSALAFDANGLLYGVSGSSTLVQLSKMRATVAVVGEIGAGLIGDIAFDPIGNRMYGLGISNNGNYELYEINASTAATSSIGQSLIRPSGLAFATVPEPGGLGLALFGLIGLTRIRRRIEFAG
ncbi:MAG: hypothetical protein AAF497_06180 [Planctomycetota bacterium]